MYVCVLACHINCRCHTTCALHHHVASHQTINYIVCVVSNLPNCVLCVFAPSHSSLRVDCFIIKFLSAIVAQLIDETRIKKKNSMQPVMKQNDGKKNKFYKNEKRHTHTHTHAPFAHILLRHRYDIGLPRTVLERPSSQMSYLDHFLKESGSTTNTTHTTSSTIGINMVSVNTLNGRFSIFQ